LVKIGQKYCALYMKTQLCSMLLAVTCNATISVMHYCVFMAMLEIFIMLLTVTCVSTIKRECIVLFPW